MPTTMYGTSKVASERLGEYYSAKARQWVDFRAVRFPSVLGAARGPGGTTVYSTLMMQEPFQGKAYEAYVPADTPLPKAYYHCCFGGGRWGVMRPIYAELAARYRRDVSFGIEPVWNDESHWNYYFHYHPPARVLAWPSQCPFKISDKAGIKDIRRA